MSNSIEPSALGVANFCTRHGISRALLYKLWKRGEGPTRLKIGRRTLITVEAAAEWRKRMEGVSDEAHDLERSE